ncbi:hypothetical protein [Prosthecomicrobium hirschii]|uniref:hypothetical protein n=1 Tax=Prosthecodimorpha hirschii TaxID=665126 RepID=UPI002220E622|nr:hypothetical protein [Prosthecomicrobium hirschii]MCW1844144.1 hypothetical protein [Prosthecomicrobium hirschii]
MTETIRTPSATATIRHDQAAGHWVVTFRYIGSDLLSLPRAYRSRADAVAFVDSL